MDLLLHVLAVVFILATLLPVWRHEAWWVRIFDFPRAQIAAGGVLVTTAFIASAGSASAVQVALMVVLLGCAVFQGAKMLPYTPIYRRQVTSSLRPADRSRRLSMLVANVLMENRNAGRLLELVRAYDPDIVLTVETDEWWVDKLSSLDASHPHTVKVPLPNTYGMQLQSRLELVDSEVEYLVEDSIPSVHTRVRLPGGTIVRVYCLHPRPPGPTEDTDTVSRDAELLVVGRRVRRQDEPTVVMGDLNDVAWSYTTKLFQKVSGLLDPRVGRGMFNTFHAGNPLLRWPLDHVFHSEHFRLVRLDRLPAWGSDHFPIFAQLQYCKDAVEDHDVPEAGPDEWKEAREMIDKAYDDS